MTYREWLAGKALQGIVSNQVGLENLLGVSQRKGEPLSRIIAMNAISCTPTR